MRRSAGLAASLFLTVLALAGCGKGGVIGSGPLPTPTPIVPKVTNEFAIPTAGSKPGGITLGVDSYLYFTEQGTSKIGRVTAGGAFNEYDIASDGGTAGAVPVDITSGPDGDLWFTEQGMGIADFQRADSKVVEYPLAGSNPTYIIPGAAPNTLVFSDPGHNAIGVYNITTGLFSETTIPTANANPMGLVIGAGAGSSNVYFAEHDASKIGIFNQSAGTIAEVPTLTPNAGPVSVVLGPDRNVWFTENSVAKIGSITPSGQMTEFPLGPTATTASALVSARDNNFYFIDQAKNSVGQISGVTPGTVNEFPVSAASAFPAIAPNVFPGKMVLGPDARVYFTMPNAGKIGQLNY